MQAIARSSGRALRPLSCSRCLARSNASSLILSYNRQSNTTTSPFATSSISKRSINTISPEEVSHFSSLSQTWWNERGDFNVLQRMNEVRVEFLKERLKMVKRYEEGVTLNELQAIDGPLLLKGMKVLDVGCGGGLFTEVRLSHSTYLNVY